jgi:hypothetical protein
VTPSDETTAHFVSCVDEPKNPRKRNESFAKRNETFRSVGRNPLKSLRPSNQNFAELFIFNDLTAFSFRAISHMPSRPEGLNLGIDAIAGHARERGHPAPFARSGFPLARE